MRAKPSSAPRPNKSSRSGNSKPNAGNPKGVLKNKNVEKKVIPDLSILRQPVDTSVNGLKQAVKVFETGTPEVLHLLTYDCDIVYECKVCRNLFRSIANFISHKRIYCTQRYSRSQDLQRGNKEADACKLIIGENAPERLPTRVTARKDLTSIVDSLNANKSTKAQPNATLQPSPERQPTTVLLEPMENTSFGVFQTVLKQDSQELMKNQVAELHNLLSQNEVVLGPDGRILQNGFSDLPQESSVIDTVDDKGVLCSICNTKFANRKTLAKHKKVTHESVRSTYSCPCCKNYFANPWSVYRHLYKVHRKTNEQVRRLRAQIHKKDIRVEKNVASNVSYRKTSPPNKKKLDDEQQKIIQDNKEWMDHLEDDGDFQRCGGCAKKFERKAALIAHSQICQKRIAACNKVEQNHHAVAVNKEHSLAVVPVVAVSPLPCSKKPIPKPSPEKKIGIQVRMNYCKSGVGSPSHPSSRQRSTSRSVLGDESDLEATSVDGRDSIFHQGDKNSLDLKESAVLKQFFKNANQCHTSERVEKVNSYLNNSTNMIDNVHSYEISTCKRSTVLRSSSLGKNKSLEAKCMQLRSALENEVTKSISQTSRRNKELGNALDYDGGIDNSSESNTSAVSSLSSQLTPLVDRGYVCEVEQSIEIKNINISRSLENSPRKETDTNSNGNLKFTVNRRTYKENIKFSPPGNRNYEETFISNEVPDSESNLLIDSSCLNDDEISVDLKPLSLLSDDYKGVFQDNELENTMYLTRNQLKAICKDDLIPNNDIKNPLLTVSEKVKEEDAKVEAKTKEVMTKRFKKYIDEEKINCKVCNKKFKSKADVYRHILSHTQWKRYKCLFNGCTFQTFLRKVCIKHVDVRHSKENKVVKVHSLVGIIDPSKWNLRLPQQNKNQPQAPPTSKIAVKKINKKGKLKKTVGVSNKIINARVVQKNKLKIKKEKKHSEEKKTSSKLKAKIVSNQKLLTDFKQFNHVPSKCLENTQNVKKIKKFLNSPKNEKRVKSYPKRSKSSFAANEEEATHSSPTSVKKSKTFDPTEQLKEKQNGIKTEMKRDGIIVVNHITAENNEPPVGKGKNSRVSSRKSSANSVDQQKTRSSFVVKLEEFNNESPSEIDLQNPEIVDRSSSLEEEESQESDKPVDDSHLKKIFMEVIFGPSETQGNHPHSRPVRNKTRPKRDSDFILGSQHKDIDKEFSEAKSYRAKKFVKTSLDHDSLLEVVKKSK